MNKRASGPRTEPSGSGWRAEEAAQRRKIVLDKHTTVESEYQAISTPRRAAAVARALGISYRHLMKLHEAGYIKKAQYGMFTVPDAAQGYVRHLKEGIKVQTKREKKADLAEWQARKVRLQVLKAEGELLPAVLVDQTTQALCAEMVALLERQPGRLASELAGISEPPVIREMLLDDCRSIRRALAAHLARRSEALRQVRAVDESEAEAPPAAPVPRQNRDGKRAKAKP